MYFNNILNTSGIRAINMLGGSSIDYYCKDRVEFIPVKVKELPFFNLLFCQAKPVAISLNPKPIKRVSTKFYT